MGGGFPIKAFGNDKLVLTEVGNGQCITSLPNVYIKFLEPQISRITQINKIFDLRFYLISQLMEFII